MNLTEIHIKDFLGVPALDVALDKPITLIAGPNASGKSATYEAIILAITGRTHRVSLKKQYKQLIHDEADTASVSIMNGETTLSAVLRKTGEHDVTPIDAHQSTVADCCLEARRITDLLPTPLAETLARLAPKAMDPDAIIVKLSQQGLNEAQCNDLRPLLRGGCEAAYKECEIKAREHRAAWKQLTGEVYGSQKAKTWTPNQRSIPDDLGELRVQAHTLQEEILAARKGEGKKYRCPDCHSDLGFHEGKLVYWPEVPELPGEDVIEGMESKLAALNEILSAGVAAEAMNKSAGSRASQALALHEKVISWSKAGKLLSPTGLPKQLFMAAIAPINQELTVLATHGMGHVVIANDATIWFNKRPRLLCSESEQWCADALFSLAMASLTDYRLCAIDRFDVLQPSKRPTFLQMCSALAGEGIQVLLFATLKQPFENESVQCCWLGDEA